MPVRTIRSKVLCFRALSSVVVLVVGRALAVLVREAGCWRISWR